MSNIKKALQQSVVGRLGEDSNQATLSELKGLVI